jgi:hypothetical protein
MKDVLRLEAGLPAMSETLQTTGNAEKASVSADGNSGGTAPRPNGWARPLHDDFDGSDFSPAGGLYFRENFEQSAGTVEFQRDVKLSGAGALKLSVRPIASASGNGHSERAEIWEKTNLRVPYGQGVWYGFAVKFADPIPNDGHRYLIAQWKREIEPDADGDFSPFLALRMRNGKLFATIETSYIAPDGTPDRPVDAASASAVPVYLRPHKNQMRALIATDSTWTSGDNHIFHDFTTAVSVTDHGNRLPSPSLGWIEFAIFTKPDPDGNGHIEIIANGKPVVTARGRIGHKGPGLGRHQYFKFGPYRAAHTNEWTLYYDYFRRSPLREDVVR